MDQFCFKMTPLLITGILNSSIFDLDENFENELYLTRAVLIAVILNATFGDIVEALVSDDKHVQSI